ncbi:MAG: hypothetical protein IPH07_31915 [Deltaproteobacteria bacterium]|nr:hypothetical protein [Deltaproteobacteria bacterium]MBK8715525.1 hypothetical protein [Deltaproteobacteria bacterium]MBP7288426.1 hypothetical protein [Nannocystaceae bacterium]
MARPRARHLVPAFVLAAIAGCLSGRLEDEPCLEDKECWTDQVCVRTDAERAADLPGICRPKGESCAPGKHLGCSCDPANSYACDEPALPDEIEYPAMICDATALVCVLDSEASSSGSSGDTTESSDTTTEG